MLSGAGDVAHASTSLNRRKGALYWKSVLRWSRDRSRDVVPGSFQSRAVCSVVLTPSEQVFRSVSRRGVPAAAQDPHGCPKCRKPAGPSLIPCGQRASSGHRLTAPACLQHVSSLNPAALQPDSIAVFQPDSIAALQPDSSRTPAAVQSHWSACLLKWPAVPNKTGGAHSGPILAAHAPPRRPRLIVVKQAL